MVKTLANLSVENKTSCFTEKIIVFRETCDILTAIKVSTWTLRRISVILDARRTKRYQKLFV